MAWFRCGGGGITSDEVNAVKANVLEGKTALTNDSNDEVATGELPLSSVLVGNGGTMPNNGSQSATLGFGGSKTIPAGYTSGGTVSVSITDRRGWYGGVGVGGTTYIPEGYHNGNGYVYGPSDGKLVAGNIRSGVSIFGVSGNVNKYGSASEVTGLDGTDNISTTNSGTIQMNYHVANLGFYCQGFTAGYSGDTSKGCLLNDNCLAFSTRSGTGYQATYRSNGWAHNAGVPDYHCPRVWGTGDSMYVTYWGYF